MLRIVYAPVSLNWTAAANWHASDGGKWFLQVSGPNLIADREQAIL